MVDSFGSEIHLLFISESDAVGSRNEVSHVVLSGDAASAVVLSDVAGVFASGKIGRNLG